MVRIIECLFLHSLFIDCETLKIKSDLVYCKSRIGMLESQLHNKDTELQERAILHEREISELKRAHDVS